MEFSLEISNGPELGYLEGCLIGNIECTPAGFWLKIVIVRGSGYQMEFWLII